MPVDGPNTDFATIVAPGTAPKIHTIFDFTAEALEQLAFWLEQRGLHIPINQILGFSQFTMKYAEVTGVGVETTTSTTFTSLATAGPELTGLSDGVYVVLFTCAQAYTTSAGQPAYMGVGFNGNAPAAANYALTTSTAGESLMGIAVGTLTNAGNNTVTAQYKVGGGVNTASFSERRVVALKVANA